MRSDRSALSTCLSPRTSPAREMVQGRLKVVTAYTRSKEKIDSQKKVKVIELLDARTLIVEPLGVEKKEEKEQ